MTERGVPLLTSTTGVTDGFGVNVGIGVKVGVGVKVRVGVGVGVGGMQFTVTSSGPTFPGWFAAIVTTVGSLQLARSVSVTVISSTFSSVSRTSVSMVM